MMVKSEMEVARTASGDEDITDVMRKGPFTYEVHNEWGQGGRGGWLNFNDD